MLNFAGASCDILHHTDGEVDGLQLLAIFASNNQFVRETFMHGFTTTFVALRYFVFYKPGKMHFQHFFHDRGHPTESQDKKQSFFYMSMSLDKT